jgi:hypothetical protein
MESVCSGSHSGGDDSHTPDLISRPVLCHSNPDSGGKKNLQQSICSPSTSLSFPFSHLSEFLSYLRVCLNTNRLLQTLEQMNRVSKGPGKK